MKTTLSRIFLLLALILVGAGPSAHAFYNPSVGKWVSRDPIVEDGGLNLTAIGNNDTLGTTDAMGLLVGSVNVSPWAPVIVNRNLPQTFYYRRGWLVGITWTPPAVWKGWGCNCVPCQKVVWVQDVAYGKGSLFEEDWGVADAHKYGYAWNCGASGSGGAAMFDQPDQHGVFLSLFTSPYSFYARSFAKCVAGRDAGKTYAKVLWGFRWTKNTTPIGLGPIIY